MLRIGLVGCGTIGLRLARTLDQQHGGAVRVVAVHDTNPEHVLRLQQALRHPPRDASLPALIRQSDVVVEAASAAIAGEVALRALRAHRRVLIMSVGGLLQDRRWERAARRSRGVLHVPSGALAGLDGIAALARGRIAQARLVTRKPPHALRHAPYVLQHGLKLTGLRKPTVIFEGSPQQVVRGFPQNTNVAAALTLAVGPRAARHVRVQVVADPGLSRNRHEVEVTAEGGRIRCEIESRPSENPKTSELAVQSAIATLERYLSKVVIGT